VLLTEDDLRQVLSIGDAIGAVEETLRERTAGTARVLPRQAVPVRGGSLVVTSGGVEGPGVAGVRLYAVGYAENTQLTAVWDCTTGRLAGIIMGGALGAMRTGAIGGVAFKLLAPAHVDRVGVIGAGAQARTQLLALAAVRQPSRVAVYRRDPERRRHVAQVLAAELDLPVEAAPSAEAAVREADVIITATNSGRPVIDPDWVRQGAHVSSLGPLYRDRTELDPSLVERADVLVTDFPEQYEREDQFLLQGTPHLSRLQDLAALAAAPPARPETATTLFLSHGLAGTDMAVAAVALANARRLAVGRPLPES
jgi:ornithine cyclodeaminase/alanine dehydrogenase-like protein (mu-crystallin family)